VTADTDLQIPAAIRLHMPNSLVANFVHCVFSTKGRRDSISIETQPRLYAYLAGIARKLEFDLLIAGGTTNHIHLLIALPPTLRLAEAIQKLKANSSRWMREQGAAFEWQEGYGAFSVSPSQVPKVRIYIRNQAEHHRKRSFEEELQMLLEKSGMKFDREKLFAA
jgi:REP element-mobilizing transposase RayT